MMTFLMFGLIGLVVAAVLFVVMLPIVIIGGVFRILTLPFRLLFGRPWGCYRHAGYRWGYAGPWGGPPWRRRRGPFSRW
jgi:hypothetical protein